MSVNQYKNGKLIKIAGNVRDDDTANSIVTFESGDNLNPVTPTDVPLITSGETHSSLLKKVTTMAKNTRYLLNLLGTTDISAIADGTVTGAIGELNTGIANLDINYAHVKEGVNIGDKLMLYQNNEGGNIAIYGGGNNNIMWEMDSYDGFVFRIYNDKTPRAFSFSWDMSIFNIGDYLQILNNSGYTVMLTSGDHFDFKDMSGNLVNIGALGFVVGSSRRYKDNVHPMTDDRAKRILDLDIVTYDYKQDYADAHDLAGVIAEDCIPVIPEAVICRKIDGKMQPDAVDYTRFIPYLIKMVQMQQEQIRELQEQVNLLLTSSDKNTYT